MDCSYPRIFKLHFKLFFSFKKVRTNERCTKHSNKQDITGRLDNFIKSFKYSYMLYPIFILTVYY